MKAPSSKKEIVKQIGQQLHRTILHLPRTLLLEHIRWLTVTLLIIGAGVSIWILISFLFFEPGKVVGDTPDTVQLATGIIDELELYIEQRQQERQTPMTTSTTPFFIHPSLVP